MVKVILCLLIGAVVALGQGCSAESARRTAYETVQNIGQQQCEKSLSSDCQERQSYEEYQRHLREYEEDQ